MKWGFIPQNDGKPHYLVVNADEGEPGTCKDLPLMMADPHSLIEGVIIASYAIRANFAVDLHPRRGRATPPGGCAHAVERGVRQGVPRQEHPRQRLRPRRGRPQRSGRLHLRRGDGAARLAGGLPRPAPAAAAVPGHARPLRLARPWSTTSRRSPACPYIVLGGSAWFRSMGTEKSPGPKIYSISGRVNNPGQYECGLGITLRRAASTWPAACSPATS